MKLTVCDGIKVYSDWEISEEEAGRFADLGKGIVSGCSTVTLRRANDNEVFANFMGEYESNGFKHFRKVPRLIRR